MQDQREESKNLSNWLNERNAMGKHSYRRSDFASNVLQQSTLHMTNNDEAERTIPQASTLVHPDAMPTERVSGAGEKRVFTARTNKNHRLRMRFSDATDINTQYQQTKEKMAQKEVSIITPRVPIQNHDQDMTYTQGNAIMGSQSNSLRTSGKQFHQRGVPVSFSSSRGREPQTEDFNKWNKGMFESQNLVMGFQPILQGKVVGPNYRGPIYVEDKARKDKSARNSSNSHCEKLRFTNRHRKRYTQRIKLNFETAQIADSPSHMLVIRSPRELEAHRIQSNQSGETQNEQIGSIAVSLSSPSDKIVDPKVVQGNREAVTLHTPLTERNFHESQDK